MGVETVLFKSEEKKNAAEIAATLRLIADKIEAGSLTLKRGDQQLEIEFPGQMVLELKCEEKQGRKTKRTLEIELEWVPGEAPGDEQTVIE